MTAQFWLILGKVAFTDKWFRTDFTSTSTLFTGTHNVPTWVGWNRSQHVDILMAWGKLMFLESQLRWYLVVVLLFCATELHAQTPPPISTTKIDPVLRQN